MPETREPMVDFPQQSATLRVLWFALTVAGLIYGAIAAFVTIGDTPPPALVLYGLGGVGVLGSVNSFLFRSWLLSPVRLAKGLQDGGPAGAVEMIVQGHVVAWALADSSAVMGMVVGILRAPPVLAFGLIAVGTAVLLLQGPGAHTIADLLTAAEHERLRTQA